MCEACRVRQDPSATTKDILFSAHFIPTRSKRILHLRSACGFRVHTTQLITLSCCFLILFRCRSQVRWFTRARGWGSANDWREWDWPTIPTKHWLQWVFTAGWCGQGPISQRCYERNRPLIKCIYLLSRITLKTSQKQYALHDNLAGNRFLLNFSLLGIFLCLAALCNWPQGNFAVVCPCHISKTK